jgi:hypothetical protein
MIFNTNDFLVYRKKLVVDFAIFLVCDFSKIIKVDNQVYALADDEAISSLAFPIFALIAMNGAFVKI